VKRFNSFPIAIALFAVLLVSAGAYFHNIDAHSYNVATDDVQPAAAAAMQPEPVCEPPQPQPEVALLEVAPVEATPSEEIAPVKNEPTPAPMRFRPPQPSGQVVCVEVQVEQVASSGSRN